MIKGKHITNQVINIRLALGIKEDGSESILIGKEKDIRTAIIANRYARRLQHGLYPRGTFLLSACDLHEADDLHNICTHMLGALNNLGSDSHVDMESMLDSKYISLQNPLYSFFLQLYQYGEKVGYTAFQNERLFDRIAHICDFGEIRPLGSGSLLENWNSSHHTDYKEIIGYNNVKYVISDNNGVGNVIQFAVDHARDSNCEIVKDLVMNRYVFNDSTRKEMV